MAYRKIEEIVVNGISGEIFEAYIYGSNLELGFSESPTKLTLNIVKESGDFDSFPNSLLTSYEIKVGSLTLSKMYLYSYEISRSVGQKVATLNFLDGSFILDKIFVGLVNRHGATGNGPLVAFSVPASCLACDGSTTKQGVGDVIRSVFSGKQVNVDPLRGGSIILGQEQFVEGFCDIPDVAYNFGQLLSAVGEAGITVSNLIDINPKYNQSYVGSLREVLSNWCSDFGYTFYWDLTNNGIKGVDLKIEIDYIDEIKTLVKNNSKIDIEKTNEDTLAIESFNESYSLEGTVTQKHISRYLKPARVKNISNTVKNKRTFNCIKPDIKKWCTSNDIIRAGLGKYSQAARTVYCLKNLAQDGKYIGITNVSLQESISSSSTEGILTKAFDFGYNNTAIIQYIKNHDGAQISIGLYDPSLEESYIAWESEIANMIGKYYNSVQPPSNSSRVCANAFFASRNISVTPSGEIYSEKNKYDLPFSKVIIGPNLNEGNDIKGKFYVITRSGAVYGTTQEQYDAKFRKGSGDIFEKYMHQMLPLEGLAYSRLNSAKINAEQSGDTATAQKLNAIISLADNIRGTGGQKKVVLIFTPPNKTLSSAINASLTTSTNKFEIAQDSQNPSQPECQLACERNIVDEVCGKCPDDSNPFVGLSSTSCRALKVSSKDGQDLTIKFPSEASYVGYEEVSSDAKFTIQGQKLVFGEVGAIDDNTLSLNVLESDITNDLDPVDGSSVLNMYVPDGAGAFGKTTPAAYHADLTQKLVNSITTPRKNISISIIGTRLGELNKFITPDKGLTNFSVNLNENGATVQVAFANRPKVLPKREAVAQKIAPSIKLNTFR